MFRDLCFKVEIIFDRECRLSEDIMGIEGRRWARWLEGETVVVVESEMDPRASEAAAH